MESQIVDSNIKYHLTSLYRFISTLENNMRTLSFGDKDAMNVANDTENNIRRIFNLLYANPSNPDISSEDADIFERYANMFFKVTVDFVKIAHNDQAMFLDNEQYQGAKTIKQYAYHLKDIQKSA